MLQAQGTQFDWQPVGLSLQIAAGALLIVVLLGTLAAWWCARDFRGQSVLESLFLLPLVLPPIVTGYALLVLIGRRGVLGKWLFENFDFRLIFTPYAAILAASVVAFPLMFQSAKAAFISIDARLLDAARSLGASPLRVFWTIILPLAWPGLAAGALLSFARALGEFGATIMVAGNIAGQTTTMPTAIYMATESGDLETAGRYALLLAVFNLGFVLGLKMWLQRQRKFARSK